MGKIIRCISVDGAVSVMAVDSTDIINRAEQIHHTSAVVTAALGRLMTAASMMGDNLKGKDDSVTLRMNGAGPSGSLIAVSDSSGNVRGYVENPIVEIPLNNKGKLDVAGAVGTDGFLYVMKDLGMKEPYISQVPIVSGEIAEDITGYFAVSEQIPTVCALGVLVNPDLSVNAAGGFLVQLLPFAQEETICKVERCVNKLRPVTEMLHEGMTPEEICREVLSEFTLDVLDENPVEYRCNCSKERVKRALLSCGKDEIRKIAEEDGHAEISCHFCDKKYSLSKAELLALLD